MIRETALFPFISFVGYQPIPCGIEGHKIEIWEK